MNAHLLDAALARISQSPRVVFDVRLATQLYAQPLIYCSTPRWNMRLNSRVALKKGTWEATRPFHFRILQVGGPFNSTIPPALYLYPFPYSLVRNQWSATRQPHKGYILATGS